MTEKKDNKYLLLQYAGMTFQFFVAIGLAVYAGYWLDKWIKSGIPLFIWLLPLITIVALIVKVVKDTSKK